MHTRPYRCKLCDSIGIGWYGANEKAVVQHVVMTYGVKDKGGIHKAWREQHNLPIKSDTMSEVLRNVAIILRDRDTLDELCELVS